MNNPRSKYPAWILGLLGLSAALLFISMYPIPSLLKWQSPFLSRCFFILMLCFIFCLFRLMLGPTAADRAAAVYTLEF